MAWLDPMAMLQSLPAWVVAAVFQVTVLLLLVILASRFVRNAPAATRHTLWAGALIGALALPGLASVLPSWSLPLLPPTPEAETSQLWVSSEVAAQPRLESTTTHSGVPATDNVSDPAGGSLAPAPGSTRRLPAPQRWLLAVWLTGCVLVLIRLGLALYRMWRLSRRATTVTAEVTEHLRAGPVNAPLRSRAPKIHVLQSAEVPAPVTWGWLRPEIILPRGSESWPSGRMGVVLLHEQIHIRAAHWILQIAAQICCAIYWFHPLAWLAARQLKLERENACDAEVLAQGAKPSEYASHLVAIARSMKQPAPASAAGIYMAQESPLERRLMAILNDRQPRQDSRKSLITVAVLILSVGAVAAIQPFGKPSIAAADTAASFEASTDRRDRGSGRDSTTTIRSSKSEDGRIYSRTGYYGRDYVMERHLDDFSVMLRIEDPDTVEFNRAGDEIAKMGRHAVVLLRTETQDARQRLEITRDRDGALEYDWTVDGEDRVFDAEGREWMRVALAVANGWGEASSLRGQQSSLRGKISSIRGKRSSLRGKISSVRGKRSSLRGKISSIRGHVSSLRGKISSIHGKESSMRGKVSSLRGKISSLSSQKRRSSSGGSDPSKMRRLAEEMNAIIDRDINQVRAQIADVESQIEAYDTEARVREVEREIEEYDAPGRIREVEAQLEALDVEGRVREIEAEITALDVDGRVEEIEEQIRELNADERANAIMRRVEPLLEDLEKMSRKIR